MRRIMPLLVNPDPAQLMVAHQGQLVIPLVDGSCFGNMQGSPLSAIRVSTRPGHVAEPRQCNGTWVFVLLWAAGPLGAIIMFGPTMEGWISQAVGQLLAIPPRTPNATWNPNTDDEVITYEFRTNPSIHNDNVVLAHLRPYCRPQTPFYPPEGASGR